MGVVVVYFHGYGSSPNTDKVAALRDGLGVPVHAFPIDVDPDVARAQLTHNIDMLLLDDMHAPDRVVFVGTSLGGWWASEMADLYGVPAVVINPSRDPARTLDRYGVPELTRAKYSPIKMSIDNVYFFAERDDVIDNTKLREVLLTHGYEVYVDETADHRFNGKPFERVIEYIKKKYL